MLRRVGFTLIVLAAVAVSAPAAFAQTTTSTPVVTTTPRTTVAPTTVPPTTRARVTTTVARPTTTVSTSTTATTVAGAGAGEDGSGVSGTTIALIVGAIAVVILAIVVILLLIRQRGSKQWREQAAQAAVEGRSVLALATHGLSTLDQPAAAARTWSDLEAQGAQLHQRLQTLIHNPPEDWLGAAVASTDRSLQALRSAADADRALRLGPPPPTSEQLGYSEAVVRQRAADFEQALNGLDADLAGGGH